jgi:hypothetical protein
MDHSIDRIEMPRSVFKRSSIAMLSLLMCAVTKDSRIFLGFPRHADDHSGPPLAEYKNHELIPYPNVAMRLPGGSEPANRLVSVHGMTLDRPPAC